MKATHRGEIEVSEGDEVDLKAEVSKLVLIPVTSRKRIKLSAEIVDELVENEDFLKRNWHEGHSKRQQGIP